MKKMSKAGLWLVLPLSLVWACGSSDGGINGGSGAGDTGASSTGASAGSLATGGDGQSTGGSGSGTTGGSLAAGGSAGSAGSTVKGTGTSQCSDGIDNDGDGLIDGFDPECTGPLDNNEGSFATGIPGDNVDPKWQDCFFDGNSGAGDDGCRYATGCLTGELKPTDPSCKLTQACIKFCAPLTPNGCDCFGCCTVETDNGQTVDIMEASTCSLAKLGDEKACPRCVKSTACENTCGRCELCPGKTAADLPADCAPTPTPGAAGAGNTGDAGAPSVTPGPNYTCDGGEQVCGAGLPACPVDYYCSLGCCLIVPPR
jgi:hypothetical protein